MASTTRLLVVAAVVGLLQPVVLKKAAKLKKVVEPKKLANPRTSLNSVMS